jgi:hypothetical protein
MTKNPTIPTTIPAIAPPDRPLDEDEDEFLGWRVWEALPAETEEEADVVVVELVDSLDVVVVVMNGIEGKIDVDDLLFVVVVCVLDDFEAVEVDVTVLEVVAGRTNVTSPAALTPQSWPTWTTSSARVEFNG